MQVQRMRVAPPTAAYADDDHHKLVVEFAIPGAPTETIDVKIVEDSVHLFAKPDKAEATYVDGLLRIEVPFEDPLDDAVKVAVKRIARRRQPLVLCSP